MKFIAYSDPHIHPHQSYSKALPDGMNTRLADTLSAVSEIYKAAEVMDVPVVSGGDTFQIKNSVPVLAYIKMMEILKAREAVKAKSSAPTDVICIGNHDIANHNGTCHALIPFRNEELSKIEIPKADSPHFVSWEDGKVLISVIPYPMEHGKFCLEKFKNNLQYAAEMVESALITPKTSILLTHLFTHELMSKHLGLSGDFSAKDLMKHFDLVLLGHHHTHDIVNGPKTADGRIKKVVSIGSPLQLKLSEKGEEKGYLIIDTDTLDVEFKALNTPQFYDYDSVESLSAAPPKRLDGQFVSVRVRSKADAVTAERLMSRYGTMPASYRIEIIPETSTARIDLPPDAKDEEILKRYLKSDWGKTDLDPVKLIEVGRSYLSRR